MRENDPRAALAFAIMREILKKCYPTVSGSAKVVLSAEEARQALVICLAMLIEADTTLKTESNLRLAVQQAAQELEMQLIFMREQAVAQNSAFWDIIAVPSLLVSNDDEDDDEMDDMPDWRAARDGMGDSNFEN